MNWWDYVLISISALCTVASIVGAVKSNTYYKKSKQLTIYANTNIAYIESQKIISSLTDLLKLANSTRRQRGTNYIKEISRTGEAIKISINKIRNSMSVEDYKEIQSLLNSQELKVERYIDSFITGSILDNNELVIDDDFNLCQQSFCDMQLLIRVKLDAISEKLK